MRSEKASEGVSMSSKEVRDAEMDLADFDSSDSTGVLGGETPASLDDAVRQAANELRAEREDEVPRGPSVVETHRPKPKLGERGTDEADPYEDL